MAISPESILILGVVIGIGLGFCSLSSLYLIVYYRGKEKGNQSLEIAEQRIDELERQARENKIDMSELRATIRGLCANLDYHQRVREKAGHSSLMGPSETTRPAKFTPRNRIITSPGLEDGWLTAN